MSNLNFIHHLIFHQSILLCFPKNWDQSRIPASAKENVSDYAGVESRAGPGQPEQTWRHHQTLDDFLSTQMTDLNFALISVNVNHPSTFCTGSIALRSNKSLPALTFPTTLAWKVEPDPTRANQILDEFLSIQMTGFNFVFISVNGNLHVECMWS